MKKFWLLFVLIPALVSAQGLYIEDLTTTDDVTVGDDLAVGGDAAVTGDVVITGSLTAGSIVGSAATAFDDIGDPDGNGAVDFTDYYQTYDFGDTDHDMMTWWFTGAFGDYSCFVMEQKTGNPTNGTLLELKLADTDVDFLSLYQASEVLNIDSSGNITAAGTMQLTGLLTLLGGVSITGGLTADSVTLENGAILSNTSNTEITFTEAGEDLTLDMDASSNVIGLKSSTGVTGLALGTVDDLSGVGGIAFDAAAATITTATDGAAQDLTLSVTGATNSSLVLASSGTGADALTVSTSAGGMDLTVAGAAAGEDMDLLADSSVNITSSEAGVADAIVIQTTGAGSGLDIISLADIDLLTTGAAGEDISLTNTGGSINLTATEAATDAIVLNASTAAGGIDITSNEDIDITTTGAAGEDISITNTGGAVKLEATEAAADAITINASDAAGGIQIDFGTGNLDITGTGASADLVVDADLFSIDGTGVSNVTVTSNGDAEDFTVALAGATNSSLILSSTGTGADALQVTASAGGIDISGASGGDIDITSTAKSVIITSTEEAADAVSLVASTGAGGITLNAGTAGITFSDDALSNVGDISCDDIVSDADADVVLSGMKVLIKSIDLDDDASTDDYQLDDDAENTTEQVITLTNALPAYAELVSVQVRCFETVTGGGSMSIDVGTTTGGGEILGAGSPDTANDILTSTVNDAPELAATNAARSIYVNFTPGANWSTLDAGRWAVMITYIDYAGVYAQGNL